MLLVGCLLGDPVEQSILSGEVSSSLGGTQAQRLDGLSSETPEGRESTLGRAVKAIGCTEVPAVKFSPALLSLKFLANSEGRLFSSVLVLYGRLTPPCLFALRRTPAESAVSAVAKHGVKLRLLRFEVGI